LKILIYALGGGWGHLTRAAALARALGASADVRILTNSPYLQLVQAAMPHINIEPTPTREAAIARIQNSEMDVLVVDTFPRGLGGELADVIPSLQVPKILIHRALNPTYVTKAGLHEFVAANYDCIICPGEHGVLAGLPQAIHTAPWLIREPAKLGLTVDIVICASGNTEEFGWYGEVAALVSRQAKVRCIAPNLPPGCPLEVWIPYWPAIDWIASARAVIGGAGYNTVNECLALGVPLIAKPWPRKYDDQQERAAQHTSYVVIATIPQEACNAALEALNRPPQPKPPFVNGVSEAAARLRFLATVH
jgi:Glycosyltransferase family 28 C-terminal domain